MPGGEGSFAASRTVTSDKEMRLAIDIGGTFTDTVLVDSSNNILASDKTLTTQADPTNGALQGTYKVMEQSRSQCSAITGFIHGTTLATNALIERRGAIVTTITTEGFRDILEIAYERRYSQYDINLQKPDLIVPRDRSLTIHERMSVAGQVLIPMDESSVDQLIDNIDSNGSTAVAICLLHAYANPIHEQRLRELILEQRPQLSISLSSEVSPEAREFDRLCTTVANAYIQPLMDNYLSSFVQRFVSEGVQCPILMMTAGGGMTTIETAARFPVRLVESGPAGGAVLAAHIADQCQLDQVLSFDMGGTTAKLCLIDKARPQKSRQFEIARAARFIKGSGMPVRIPVIDMIEIGAGGGSIASVDRLGRLSVGPMSAGSEPGPAAFNRGGSEPTVTDSDVALGYIVPELFADGGFSINSDLAHQALHDKVGEAMGIDSTSAADGVSRIVDESMASASRMHAVESGKDLEQRWMIAFGGNGPLHACRVARSAGVRRILIPRDPGVGSAVGFLFAPVNYEIVRSYYTLVASIDITAVNSLLASMIDDASAVVQQGAPDRKTETICTAFMRYHGQGHEIEIVLPNRVLSEQDIALLISQFEHQYSLQYSRPVPGMQIEILNWAVNITTLDALHRGDGVVNTKKSTAHETNTPKLTQQPTTRKIICDVDGSSKDALILPRDSIKIGETIEGPALIIESQTTTLVGADFAASVDPQGNLVLVRTGES